MFHKVHFIFCMTYTCKIIVASVFIAFFPRWILLLLRIVPCATTTIACVAASTKLVAEVAPPAGFDFAVNVTCPFKLPCLGFCTLLMCLAIPVAGTTAGHRFALQRCSLQRTPIFNQFCNFTLLNWHFWIICDLISVSTS